jgi:hypothetical protein
MCTPSPKIEEDIEFLEVLSVKQFLKKTLGIDHLGRLRLLI